MTLRKSLFEARALGNCYETAGKFFMMGYKDTDLLVHGRPTLQVSPFKEFGHAWVERGDEVIDNETGYRGPRNVYYALGHIDYKKNLVYTAKQAREFMVAHEHYGPWEGPEGVGMTAAQKKRWKAKGNKPLKRTKKSRPAGFDLPPGVPEMLKR